MFNNCNNGLFSGPDSGGGGNGGSASVESEYWNHPESAHANDYEFDTDTLDPAWTLYDGATNANGTIDTVTAPNIYDTAFNSGSVVRIQQNPTNRKSHLRIQPPGKVGSTAPSGFVLHKSYGGALPTNLLMWARLGFAHRIASQTNDNACIGITMGALDTGVWDENNCIRNLLNEADLGATAGQGILQNNSSSPDTRTSTSNVSAQGQALEYVGLHKIDTTWHLWYWSNSNKLYGGNFTGLLFTPTDFGLYFSNTSPTAIVSILDADFIRFLETDKFPF